MNDNVNHPRHYTSHPSGVECITITRHYCFSIGNAIKYLWRAGLKQVADKTDLEKEIEDLRKAVWYIQDRIAQLEGEVSTNTSAVRHKPHHEDDDIDDASYEYVP